MPSASLKYSDATDRAYGLCGMAFSLFVFDAEQYIESLSVDAPADLGLNLTPDFFATTNQNLSAKAVWTDSFRHFQLNSAMVIGNLLARSITRRSTDLSSAVQSLMMRQLAGEGEEACGLETAEVNRICDKSLSYMRRMFMHPTVHATLRDMARELDTRKALSRDRIMAYLSPLARL